MPRVERCLVAGGEVGHSVSPAHRPAIRPGGHVTSDAVADAHPINKLSARAETRAMWRQAGMRGTSQLPLDGEQRGTEETKSIVRYGAAAEARGSEPVAGLPRP